MAQVKTLDDLREKMLEAFDDLMEGKIDIQQAMALSKISETVISGLKIKMQYAVLTNTKPNVPFIGNDILLPSKEVKKLK